MKKVKCFLVFGIILLSQRINSQDIGYIPNSQDITFADIKNAVLDEGKWKKYDDDKSLFTEPAINWKSFKMVLLEKGFVFVKKTYNVETFQQREFKEATGEFWASNFDAKKQTARVWVLLTWIFGGNINIEKSIWYKAIELKFPKSDINFLYLEEKIKHYCTYIDIVDNTAYNKTMQRIYNYSDLICFNIWTNPNDDSDHISVCPYWKPFVPPK